TLTLDGETLALWKLSQRLGPASNPAPLFSAKLIRRVPLAVLFIATAWCATSWASAARAADYVPGQVLVGYADAYGPTASEVAHAAREMGVRADPASAA